MEFPLPFGFFESSSTTRLDVLNIFPLLLCEGALLLGLGPLTPLVMANVCLAVSRSTIRPMLLIRTKRSLTLIERGMAISIEDLLI